jgi:tetratricopeptide (TPR) repeat protein
MDAMCNTTVANPVDTTSGMKLGFALDFTTAGPVPLKFERHYRSNTNTMEGTFASRLGRGWRSNLDAGISIQGSTHPATNIRFDREQALDYRQLARMKNPSDIGIEHALLRSLIECGRYAEAVESAHRVISLDQSSEWHPFTNAARFEKAYALYKLGRLEEAAEEFAEVEDEGNVWIDRRLLTKSLLLEEIEQARRLRR